MSEADRHHLPDVTLVKFADWSFELPLGAPEDPETQPADAIEDQLHQAKNWSVDPYLIIQLTWLSSIMASTVAPSRALVCSFQYSCWTMRSLDGLPALLGEPPLGDPPLGE